MSSLIFVNWKKKELMTTMMMNSMMKAIQKF
ncbi:unnamed protein product, partial [Strongylus vulgaris]